MKTFNNNLSRLSLLLLAGCLLTASDNSGRSSAVIAEVDGVSLTRADFESKNAGRLFQARNSFYEAERKAVDEFIDQYLLERQAEKEKVTVEQLIERNVTSTIGKEPSEESLRVYYEGIDTQESFEAVRDKIADHLRQRRIAKAKTKYMQSLRAQAKVDMRLSAPRVQVSLKDTQVRGAKDAAVLLVEYADYECPYCQQIQPALDKLYAEYKDKVAFAYKDMPLPMHANAQKASEAAHCAGTQGKYWEYHDILVTGKQLDLPRLKDVARELKLDVSGFNKCVDTGEQAAVIKAHLAEAQSLGLQGTPSFFINGRFFSGALSYEKFREIVEEELSLAARDKQTAKR
jgi:protein-disulfide isomerase